MTTAPSGSTDPARIALIGTHGFGASHLRNLARLEKEGVARLVGVVDVTEPPAELQAIHHRSLGELLDAVSAGDRPEIVIIATPIDTHVPLATEALAAGLDVYLEKPPVPALEELQQLEDAARAAGCSVQVGFQARGGAGVDLLADEVANGALGQVDTVQVYGAWQRDRAYYRRSAWAGRRRLNGRRVADGVATNPLAHSVHAGLVIAGIHEVSDIRSVTTELRRAHDIEADDTTFLRIDPVGDGPAVVCALTTAAPTQSPPWIEAVGTSGTHRLFYTDDVSRRTQSAAAGAAVELTHQRLDLLENLIAHVRDRSVGLLSSLESTGAFSAVLEAIQSAPDPAPIPAEAVDWQGEGDAAHPVVEDIEETLRRSLAEGRPFSELGVSWADEEAVQVWTPPAP
ncbi:MULTISPECIES: Gfo/Idh/MocA family protein [Brachybacterium]|uniref:Dehydrogenase n=1 Tax=Brachybacterium alimentarium TaxID=47845 RepID=A0A2A3YJI4_9MICO|nr:MULTISPECIES: Gfo/Idh/MocA family oxidoreductase [Brachybacterium]PCC33555.1 dehydrogenase [Brachybacterium alimentarium]PCC39441.1 dehydrogenase [Brachybacterium alimentarium]RCS63553.1 gfo/Idh/MocA family oxidoreductase [Brachybacterium alimentarium]RCS66395.1 gfo/Idh/MocA family oxidoreductase [Brachybacterium sp. JB7]RCS77263.1 gfo/Idh/MocA family oxidoreductase [Brachybacterium alimentarium]